MANPLFGLLNKAGNNMGGGNNFFAMFQEFLKQMQGKNPQQMLEELIKANGISQEQLDCFRAKTNEIMSGSMNKHG